MYARARAQGHAQTHKNTMHLHIAEILKPPGQRINLSILLVDCFF
jgi:hypothetical protein